VERTTPKPSKTFGGAAAALFEWFSGDIKRA